MTTPQIIFVALCLVGAAWFLGWGLVRGGSRKTKREERAEMLDQQRSLAYADAARGAAEAKRAIDEALRECWADDKPLNVAAAHFAKKGANDG